MTSKLFLFCSIFILSCGPTDTLPSSHAIDGDHSRYTFCDPHETERGSIYIATLFTKSYDSKLIRGIIVDTDDMDHLVDTYELDSEDIAGFIEIPYSGCSEDI